MSPGIPLYIYYIIAAVGSVVFLLVAVLSLICFVCYCWRNWKRKHQQGTWRSAYSQRANQNGHSYHHNGVVADVTSITKEKDGFDNPKDTLVIQSSASTPYVITSHALNHSHQDYITSPQKVIKGQDSESNGYHVHCISNGIANGFGTGQRTNLDLSPDSNIPMCPPPDYNELFQSATPTIHGNGYHSNSGRDWYGSGEGPISDDGEDDKS